MKYRVVVTKVVKSTKTIEIEAEGLDAMYKNEDAEMVRNLANIAAINDDFTDAEMTETKFIIGGIQEAEENPYIDHYGNPYDCESGDSWPAGGGLHKDCDHNAEALYAYYAVKGRKQIYKYLTERGFSLYYMDDDSAIYKKGNTEISFESYDWGAGQFGYLHTELI